MTLFKPGSSWRELLFDPALVELFFKVQMFAETVHLPSNGTKPQNNMVLTQEKLERLCKS